MALASVVEKGEINPFQVDVLDRLGIDTQN